MIMAFCPYPGLRPFRQDENEIFFGRDEQVAALLDKLAQHHFLAVIAPSGYGKSSLVRTGLLNALSGGMLPQAGSYWRIADIHPANAPFQQLAAGLLKESCLRADYADALGMKAEEFAAAMPMLEESLYRNLRRGPYSLHEIWQQGAEQRPAGTKLLILADQFEELFRYAEKNSMDESAAFAALLMASAEHPDIYVILTMRTDFLGHCARFENLPEAVSRGLYLTSKMDRDQLQEAMEGPAEMSGGSIEPALVNRLLNDLSGQQDQLPLLQHCLMRLWHQAAAEKTAPWLSLQAYERLGGLRNALSNHADEAYAELNSVQQRQAKGMFQALTEKESGLDTRRPETVGIIAQIVGQDWRELLPVIHAFKQQGRNFITATAPSAPVGVSGEQQDVLNEEALLDISHESLIRQWKQLRAWTDEEAQSARQYRRLCDKAEQWQQGNAELLWGTDLAVALNWQKKKQLTDVWARRYGGNFLAVLSFLEKSRQEEAAEDERERKRRRRTIGLLVVGLVLVSWLSIFSSVQKNKAKEQNEITVRLIRNFATAIASPKNNQQIEMVIEDINKEIYRISRKDKDSQRKKSIYLSLSGDLLSILRKNNESLQKYNNSLEIIKELAGENPEDGRLKIDLSISYRKIGNIQTKLNNNKIAGKEYDKSFSILTSGFNKEFINDSYLRALWDLSLSYRIIGDNYLKLGNKEETLNLYQKEFDLLDIYSSNTSILDIKSSIQSELNLARINKRIGEIEENLDRNEDALKRYENALKRYENALNIYHRNLADDVPINKDKKEEIAGGLANIYNSLGRVIIKMANHDTLKLAEAEAFFAKTIAIAPNVLRFLIHDMELTRLQGDVTRCRQRIATLDKLLLTPKKTKEFLYGSIVKFYDFLIEPEASWQPVLNAIERAKEIYHIFNLSQEDIYEIQQMPTFPRQATEAFIEYFKGKINLNELRQKLDSLRQAMQPPSGGQ